MLKDLLIFDLKMILNYGFSVVCLYNRSFEMKKLIICKKKAQT